MALQVRFFMVEEDERELLRRLERLELELWPELTDPSERPPIVSASVALEDDAYYLAKGDVIGHQIKKGPDRGRFRIDEVDSPVIYFCRSRLDEDGELRSGYFWAETGEGNGPAAADADGLLAVAVPEGLQRRLERRSLRRGVPPGALAFLVHVDRHAPGWVLRERLDQALLHLRGIHVGDRPDPDARPGALHD